jgi:hypothetical protein
MSCSLYNRQSSEVSGHLVKAAHLAGHLVHARISTGRQARSVRNTSALRYRGSYLMLVIIMSVGIRSATGSAGPRLAESPQLTIRVR